MPVQKKFGAFSGVFTPSILTILGVIMYMRMGWVVGQAGIITAIGIILLAHVISLSTGLSISSIATDKKIKTGGIYYILSRSLGLPMGGSIGITMFVGTALSISLYIIGFCENFLGIEIIREITGLGDTIQDYRILGTIMLVILVIIAFISTSIAIKTQFFILGAIALSLASIALGLFTGDTSSSQENASWLPVADGVSLTTVFAIFFPAVTGFTAGVALSGDLKNPQKNIPFGTMASIFTGLLVYVGLAVGFGMLVDRDLLLNDNNFLMKIAWSSPLVVAGIWGATLSSALGGILGGPRILQAMSKDRITPKFFGKGFGINKEPRNALIITFLIAEGGILIGELDVVAAIVSMFYIAAYGFINLAFALERWASADFRPSFRISKWVGIIGFAACFGVMFKLDTPVMFLAMIILAGIYLYIKRKKLELDFGDVWQSVWSSIARSILHRIDRKGLEERNWRPNVILFSGGSKSRPHLIQFGKDIVGNQGFLSNFDLILNPTSNVLFKKHQQAVEDEETRQEGMFTRRQECKDIYEGIEAISSTYGFSGVEPNTILFGWARQSQDPVRFAQMIRTLAELDLNILMMDYDKHHGFGKREIIDVWCRGGGNNCNLVLSLIKFMWLSETWKNARIRILMINPINDEKEMLIQDVEDVLENVRMDAEIKVINNQIERRPVHELIEVESSNSDIVFLGIPHILHGEEENYVNQVNHLCQNVGTVVLVKASSYFKDLEIGRSKGMVKQEKSDYTEGDIDLVISRKLKVPDIDYPDDPAATDHLRRIYLSVKKLNEEVFNNFIVDLFNLNREVYSQIVKKANERLEHLSVGLQSIKSADEWKDHISATFRLIFDDIFEITARQEQDAFKEQEEMLSNAVSLYIERCKTIILEAPEIFHKGITRQDLIIRRGDNWRTIRYKLRKQLLYGSFKGTKLQKVRFRNLVSSHFERQIFAVLTEVFQNWGMISIQQVIKTQGLNNKIFDQFFLLNKLQPSQETSEMMKVEIQGYLDYREQIDKLNEASLQTFYTLLLNKTMYVVRQIGKELQQANTSSFIKTNEKIAESTNALSDIFRLIPKRWKVNQTLLNNFTKLELELFTFITHAKDTLNKLHAELDKNIERQYLEALKNISAASHHSTQILYDTMEDVLQNMDADSFDESWEQPLSNAMSELKFYLDNVENKISLLDRAVFDDFKDVQFTDHKAVSLRARKLVDYVLKNEFMQPVEETVEETMKWMSDEIIDTMQIIEKGITTLKVLRNDKSKAADLPALTPMIESLNTQLVEAEKNKLRMLNQVRERTNALADKFSLSAVTRRGSVYKKFIR